MIKTISAVAVAALIAAALTIAPGFSNPLEANGPQPFQTSGPELVPVSESGCAQQNWPNIDASCLRGLNTGAAVKPVRIVTTNRG